jgi:carbonic anhydrase
MKKSFLPLLALLLPIAAFAEDPLEKLKIGNGRYVDSKTVCHEDWSVKRAALVEKQKPFAVIVSCSDSRVPPEIVFDQSLGDLFVVRLAGNVVDDFAIGSIEYGLAVLGARIVVVLGHSECGAVQATLNGGTYNNHIQEVVNAIRPAIETAKDQGSNQLEKAIKDNVQMVAETLKKSKPVIAEFVQKKEISVVGAYYHLESGKVEFLQDKF